MAFEYSLEFMDNQDVKGNNTTTIGNTVDQHNLANNHKSGWHTITHNNYISAEIGGATFVVEVPTENTAGGNATVSLKTAATNNLNATGTTICSITVANGTAVGNRQSIVLPPGTKRLKFLGAIATMAGNVSACNLNVRLQPAKAELTD